MKKWIALLMVMGLLVSAAGIAAASDISTFFKAASSGNVASVKSQLKANPKLAKVKDKKGKTALHVAAFSGQNGVIEVLLAGGADINSKDADARTALMKATFKGNFNTVQLLVSRGADVNAKNKDGKTALMIANIRGYGNIAGFLSRNGAR